MNITIADSDSCDCLPCDSYVLHRYRLDKTCTDLKNLEAAQLTIFAIIQPARSEHLNEIEKTRLGDKAKGLVVAHYYPQESRHSSQISEGLYVRTADAHFQINGFDAGVDSGCADMLTYQGQKWKAIKTDCIDSCCTDEPELSWVCRAYFCLDSCEAKKDESIGSPESGLFQYGQ
ncbi:MAG: hypothetical protein GKR96_04235 [Gammaproteobacteria bacterium]|nr:hypothetical protein [Gammaproteobacteria bacterium]